MTMEERYQRLEDTVRAYNPTANFDKIRAAYEFAAAAHQGQLRKDGSPFVTHPLAVAQIVSCTWTPSPSRPPCSTTPLRIPPPPTRTSPSSSPPRWRTWWRGSAS